MEYVFGVDEAGRGPLAGPVAVAAVAFPRRLSFRRVTFPLRDSKHLSARGRNVWLRVVKEHPHISYTCSYVHPKTIDRVNIAQATNLGATRAVLRLLKKLGHPKRVSVLLDGSLYLCASLLRRHDVTVPSRTIIRGDERYISIKLASIVAKMYRDRYMIRRHQDYPNYRFLENVGYGTKVHLAALRRHGPSDLHRLTFLKNIRIMES